MSDHKFSRSPVGDTSSEHAERARIHQATRSHLMASITAALASGDEPDLPAKLALLSSGSALPKAEQEQLLLGAWMAAMDRLLSGGLLSMEDQRRLLRCAKAFGLSQEALNGDDVATILANAATLADVMRGNVPDRGAIASVPIRLAENERVVCVFPRTRYLEDATRRLYVEGSSGVSLHVMKGVYYHALSFQGHPVDQADRAHVDTGTCVATSRGLYFAGSSKNLRIPYAEIMSFYPFSDGVGLMKDTPSAKLQVFATGNGWFAFNLLTNLARF